MTNFLFTGGGTAGHVNPLLTVARALVDQDPQNRVFALGTKEGLESRLVPEAGFELLFLTRLPFPRRLGFRAVVFPFKFLSAVSKVRKYIRARNIGAVVGFGGYISAPAYVAARFEKVPLIIHEANALPGIANKFGNRFASAAGRAFRSAQLQHSEFVGMPIRQEILKLASHKDQATARKVFGLKADQLTVLVTGGSLGAKSINDTVESSRPLLAAAGIQLLHIVGGASELGEISEAEYCRVKYIDQMETAIAAADFAISRAGAATVSEFSAVGLPALYIPYPVGNGEQKYNVADVVSGGGALTISDSEFTPDYVRSVLIPILSDAKKLTAMSSATREVGVLDGTERFINLIDEVISRK